jgi:hypothetical protein
MSLVIEDGSLVSDASSYVSVEDVRAYAAARASTVPAVGAEGDAAIEAACIVANDYLETFRDEFKGSKVAPATQSLQWPRTGATLDGAEIPPDVIPKLLRDAQCQLAIESVNGLDLMPTGDGREVIRKKIDVLETEWRPGSGGAAQPILTKVRKMLEPLLSGSGFGLQVIRA